MAERNWNELVAEGKKLLADQEKTESEIKWHWADLALEVEPPAESGTRPRAGAYSRLRSWAEEIGWFETDRTLDTLADYRSTAMAWLVEERCVGATFSTHRELRDHADRVKLIKPGLSRKEARRLAGRKVDAPVPGTGVAQVKAALADPVVAREVLADPQVRHVIDESRPAEDREEQARRLVRDPQIAEAIHRDPKVAPTLRRASAKVTREVEQAAHERQRERVPELVNRSQLYEIAGRLGHARRDVNGALDGLREIELDDDSREMLMEEVRDVETSLGWLRSFLESGDRSFEAALNRLLEEGE
jgi:hypothetical protein